MAVRYVRSGPFLLIVPPPGDAGLSGEPGITDGPTGSTLVTGGSKP
jgi:hypothetical protein